MRSFGTAAGRLSLRAGRLLAGCKQARPRSVARVGESGHLSPASRTTASRVSSDRPRSTARCSTTSPSTFVLTGSNRGRQVRLWGIISRLRDGRIVEDYSAFDSLELLKQLGLWRTVLAALRMLRALRHGRSR